VVAPGVQCRGWLRQLGLGGAMVALPMGPASQLGRGDRLELRFTLPVRPEPFWFLAIGRGLSRAGAELGCSLRFDRSGTVDFAAQRDQVAEIVAMRLAEQEDAPPSVPSVPPVPPARLAGEAGRGQGRGDD
jgi:hypothetical protein